MGKNKSKVVQTTGPDPQSAAYIEAMRRQAQEAAGAATGSGDLFTGPQTMSIGDQAAQFFNPYRDQVIGAVQGQYDQLRRNATLGTNQEATQAGAFGGSRQAVLEGARLGQLDQGQASTIADLLSSGYQTALDQGTAYSEQQRQLQEQKMQEPLWRQQQALQFLNMGMGPVGQQVTQPKGSALGSAAGGALAGSAFGPWGAAIGGGLGLLGGLFG